MKEDTLRLIVCPTDGVDDLEFHVFTKSDRPWGEEIDSGILICPKCKRWYPIEDEILFLLSDDERLHDFDVLFIEKNENFFRENHLYEFKERNDKSEVKCVQNFWSEHVCQGVWENEAKQMYGTEELRYALHPWLPEYLGFKNYSRKLLLEIGCGQGIDLVNFSKNDAFTVGVDLTYIGIRLAKKRAEFFGVRKNCDFIVANAEKQTFKNKTFDMVYSYGAIHHTKNTKECIMNIYKAAKIGGEIKIMVYHKFSLVHLRDNLLRFVDKTATKIFGENNLLKEMLETFNIKGDDLSSVKSFVKTGKSAILHAPYSKGYSKADLKNMLPNMKKTEFTVREPAALLNRLTKKSGLLDKIISQRLGFHLMMSAIK